MSTRFVSLASCFSGDRLYRVLLHRPIRLAASLSLVIALGACSPTATSTEAPSATGTSEASSTADSGADPTVYAESGVAIAGADPVAYFTDESFVEGSSDFTHEWKGVSWQFATAENRDLFAANPEEYAPQYGGYCAWAVGQNALAAIDPNAWSIVDGKLYLNANKRIQARWNKDIPGNIALAEANWPGLSQ
ncbi:MAG: YHS domain-containing (seleno)protein [Cyanobacteria bacterium J06598_1]